MGELIDYRHRGDEKHLESSRRRRYWDITECARGWLEKRPERAGRSSRFSGGDWRDDGDGCANCTGGRVHESGEEFDAYFFPRELRPEEVAKWEALNLKAVQEEECARHEAQEEPTMAEPESWVVHAKTFEKR